MHLNSLALFRSRLPMRALAAAALGLVLLVHAARAVPIAIDTTALAGQDGLLAFDLIQGDAVAANNTASVSLLATDGALASSDPFSFSDVDFFNEVLLAVTFGTFLTFNLELTENFAAPGAFDQFSFFLLDSTASFSLLGTTDPFGSDALFAIDITGETGGATSTFDSLVPGASWQVDQTTQPVPDTGSTLMLGVGSILAFGIMQRVRRYLA